MKGQVMKIITYVPASHADVVREALGRAGAGKIGNYTFCSFTSEGVGRFLPNQKANPAIGKKGKLTAVKEQKIETFCEKRFLKKAVKAMIEAHPYEEPAFDIYPIQISL